MLLYRLNQVPDRHYRAFLDLIGVTVRADETTQAAISRAIRALGARSRAVSPADFEHLARHVASRGYDTGLADKILAGTARLEDFEVLAADAPSDVIVRARALADRNLERPTGQAEGHVSVVVLPSAETLAVGATPRGRTCADLQGAAESAATTALVGRIERNLQPFRLLTTVVHVVAPAFVEVDIAVTVVRRAESPEADVSRRVDERVRQFVDPYVGGDLGTGWAFGRALYRSELYQVIEGVAGVDHVEALRLNGSETLAEVAIGDHALLCARTLTVTVASAPI
jgi:hypothetical protein